MLDTTKPVQLRNGMLARIVCTDFVEPSGNFPILALVPEGNRESVRRFTKEGKCFLVNREYPTDLINVPPPKVPLPQLEVFFFKGHGFGVDPDVFGVTLTATGDKEGLMESYARIGYTLVARVPVTGFEGDGLPTTPPTEDEDEEE